MKDEVEHGRNADFDDVFAVLLEPISAKVVPTNLI